ncbi:MAG: hypothetical protein MK135_12630 [Polyangiaceae bacterium]|nr:hypothetical protein [Polyangiaceae bacterium]
MKQTTRLTRLFVLLTALFLGACTQRYQSPVAAEVKSQALNASFGGLDGQVVQLAQFRGRVTVLLFFATYDLSSQIAARRLDDFYHAHQPKVNALGVALEAPRNVELVRAFGEFIEMDYPLVMMSRQGSDIFSKEIYSVPAWVILKPDGSIAASLTGAPSLELLEKTVRQAH